MNEKKEFLNEEWYQEKSNKLKNMGKIVLIVGIIILIISLVMIFLSFTNFGQTFTHGIESADTGNLNNSQMARGVFGSVGFFALGGFINTIGFAITIAGIVMIVIAHKREITSFTAQQVMPVAQEGIEKMAPTVGNAAKEIARGIKEGLSETTNVQSGETSEALSVSANDDLVSETQDNIGDEKQD